MKSFLIAIILTVALSASAQLIITPNPTNVVQLRDCTGTTAQDGFNYTKSPASGWGWATNAQPLRATGCLPGTVVHYVGKNGDTGCATNAVTIPWPAPSPTYRFSQSFPNGTINPNKATLTLNGFNP